ncbi:MAG: cytochrome c3 family protein [Myxococcaceae bacterium]
MAQIFSRWHNDAPRYTFIAIVILGALGTFAAYYWMSPLNTDVGYAPEQPIPYSHKLHAGDMAMDCRYCHAYVERGPHAGVPATQVCMNCHRQVKADSPKLAALRESWDKGTPIAWKRIHKVPDFAYFDHSAHVGVGVRKNRAAIGCETCHGRIDTMEVVRQEKPLSMSWCVDCHNNPAPNLRPVDAITQMGWAPSPTWRDEAARIATSLNPPGRFTDAQMKKADGTVVTFATAGCSGCHR